MLMSFSMKVWGYWALHSERPWLFVYDSNSDGHVNFLDFWNWALWAFFWPGDFVINCSINSTFFNIIDFDSNDFFSVKSFCLSLGLWLIFLHYLSRFCLLFFGPICSCLSEFRKSISLMLLKMTRYIEKEQKGFLLILKTGHMLFGLILIFFFFLAINLTKNHNFQSDLRIHYQNNIPPVLLNNYHNAEIGSKNTSSDQNRVNSLANEEIVIEIQDKKMNLIKPEDIVDEELDFEPDKSELSITQTAQALAERKDVEEYMQKIGEKIRDNVSFPLNVDGGGVTFEVLVTYAGIVVKVNILHTSGNEAYDAAVEKAILKAQPLPMPSNEEIYSKYFRLFKMTFRQE